ncbi:MULTISPECIES: TonB-dependent receptor plug domain-containing protein [Rufibacter]|uniref:TonB-dependent receptor plug domain-containing protein n=1 Tax=Rufibacter quisquiliarum TaxID=1549639 RepID=A0A839GQ05_9BACT|nr:MULTISPECIES: TonB-dependent receptor plug domain-containing protein [Rufibacter]MBA9075921.1 hypothetical protein [Rufibacter quisquiliarum]
MPLSTRTKISICLLLPLAALAFSAFAPAWQQSDLINRLVAKLTFLHNRYPQEKVYLHLDKPYYAAGEDIWFKAYLVNAHDHTPSTHSRVLYVELITPENTFFRTAVFRLSKGQGAGNMELPDDIPEGMYRLRAYTSWMQNFDEDYVYHQNLNIFSPRKTDLVSTTAFTYKRQGAGDSVLVNLRLLNYQEKPLAQTAVAYSTSYDKKASSKKITTNADGKALLRLYLPDGASQSPKLHFTVEQGGRALNHTIAFPQKQEQIDLQFFPEGGNLVSGLWNTIAFKAVDANGLGKEVQGGIYNQQGQKLLDFKSQKFGMGRFGFVPEAGKKYTARLTTKGAAKEYALPEPQQKGFILTVDSKAPENLRVKFYTLGFSPDSTGRPKTLTLVGQVRGEILYAAVSPTARDVFQVEIPASKFPTGIVQFTVFSEKGEPLAERLVFVKHSPQLQLTLTPDKPAYKPREKVTLQLQAKDEAGAPVAGHFSLAVTDQKAVIPAPNAANIVSYLLMSSDLKGYIEEPSYYFTSSSPEVATALDNLMLTQGWRRFIWKDLLLDKFPSTSFKAEKGLYLSGTSTKLTGQPDAYASVVISDLNNLKSTITIQTDDRGKFSFPLDSFTDSSNLVVKSSKGVGSMLVLDNNLPQIQVHPQAPYHPVPAPFSNEVWTYLQRNREQLKLDQYSGKSSILLQQVIVRGRKEEERPAASGNLHATPDYILKGSDLSPGINIIQSLQGRVAGLQVTNGQVSMRGGGSPLYLLDGMPSDAQFIQSINPNEVESVEVLKPGASSAIYGGQGGNGVIAINLKKGGSSSSNTSPTGGAAAQLPGTATYQGLYYSKTREFYQPKYDKPDTSNVVMPDLRTTLFWSPTVQTDATGKAEITFYAADQKTTYQAVLQGMTATGKVGYLRNSFLVK